VAHGLSNAMLFPAVTAYSVSGAEARYAQCARAYGVADPSSSDEIASRAMVEALTELCRDLEVPTPKSYGIDQGAWTRLTPLMAEQAIASGSPANNPVVPTLDEIECIYGQVYA
jgi:alcohol dehydrogenase class IV